jgi:hypothetical protein
MGSEKLNIAKEIEWLDAAPPLEELCARYPKEWEWVQQELGKALANGGHAGLHGLLKRLSMSSATALSGQKGSASGRRPEFRLVDVVRYRMAQMAAKQHLVAVSSGIESGKVRFNMLNGLIAQKLLFVEALERKPVSMFWFRLVWPLLWQKRLLMPLVQPEGIYCFYSAELINELARLINGRRCCELAAGDGTLSRFLRAAGVDVNASDDYSWEHSIRYPEWVARKEARDALKEHAPEVVICSWPPAGNSFEKQIFKTRSVQMYIVIGSRHQLAAGNLDDYNRQTNFDIEIDERLSRLVLPPELDPAVYVFRRKS